LTLIQRFESLTGHHLSSAQIKELAKSGSLTSEGETRFVQSLEKVTGNEISNSQVTQVEGSGSGSVNSEGETALIQRFERLTGHNLTSTQLTELEGSGSLNSEGETQFLASLEKVTGHELSNTEVTAVEGSGSINSEGESSSTQHVENVTGQEIGSEEAAEVEGSTSEEAEETSSEENAENNVETTTTENNESASTQIAEGEIVPITGGVATTTSTILAGTVGSLNNQTTGVDTFVIGNTNVQVNSGLSGANQIQNGLNVELGGTVDSNGNFVASSVMAVTNNAITVVSGTVSSLNETGSVDTFLIGNTTIQLGDSLEGTTEFTNGETIKLDGFFTSSENFVATSIVSVTQ
jgi:hypothetical protein